MALVRHAVGVPGPGPHRDPALVPPIGTTGVTSADTVIRRLTTSIETRGTSPRSVTRPAPTADVTTKLPTTVE